MKQPQKPVEVLHWDHPDMVEERQAFARRQERHRRPIQSPSNKPAQPKPPAPANR